MKPRRLTNNEIKFLKENLQRFVEPSKLGNIPAIEMDLLDRWFYLPNEGFIRGTDTSKGFFLCWATATQEVMNKINA